MREPMLVAVALVALTSAPVRADEAPLWFWLEECGGPRQRIELEVDGVRVEHATVPICRRLRSEQSGPSSKTLRFQLTASRAIEWRGYRDDIDGTPAGAPLEVELWEAGAEEDAIILGVVVSTGQEILAHTHLVALPLEPAEVTLAEGIVLRSAPLPLPRPQEHP